MTHSRPAILSAFAFVAFAALMTTTLVTMAIWPGEAKLTAPVFCTGETTDAFVVFDRYSAQPGETTYNYSLYCMGPRGQVDEVGFSRPAAVLTVGHAALIVVVAGGVLLLRRRRRVTRAGTPQDAPA